MHRMTEKATYQNLQLMGKITLSSFYNMTIILASLIGIFINMTLSFNKTSIFFAQSMPFIKQEVSFSRKVFKLSFAILLFEGVLIIALPGLTLFPMGVGLWVGILATIHLLFTCVFLFVNLIRSLIINLIPKSLKETIAIFFDGSLLLLSLIYMFSGRFTVDFKVGNSSWSYSTIIFAVFIISFFILGMDIFVEKFKIFSEESFSKRRFISIKKIKFPSIRKIFFLAILKSINFVYLMVFLAFSTLILLLNSGLSGTEEILMYVFPFISIALLTYGEDTHKVRKLFNLLQIKLFQEFISLNIMIGILLLPVLCVGLIAGKSVTPYVFGLCFSISATIFGFLFQRSKGNMNELISSFLVLIVFIILMMLANFGLLLYPMFVALNLLLIFVLKKETEIKG